MLLKTLANVDKKAFTLWNERHSSIVWPYTTWGENFTALDHISGVWQSSSLLKPSCLYDESPCLTVGQDCLAEVESAWVSTPLFYKRHRRAAVGTRGTWAFDQWESPPEEVILRMIFLIPDISTALAGSSVEKGRVLNGIDEKLTIDWQWPVTRESMCYLRPCAFSEWYIHSCKTKILIRISHHFQSWAS